MTGPSWCQTQAIGICGTDLEIINGEYGWAPPGQDRLVIGHESLGRVIEATPGTGDSCPEAGAWATSHSPSPFPARPARARELGHVHQRPVHRAGHQGPARLRRRAVPHPPGYLVAVDPALGTLGVLLEPATVVAKAWDGITQKIGRRSTWAPTGS